MVDISFKFKNGHGGFFKSHNHSTWKIISIIKTQNAHYRVAYISVQFKNGPGMFFWKHYHSNLRIIIISKTQNAHYKVANISLLFKNVLWRFIWKPKPLYSEDHQHSQETKRTLQCDWIVFVIQKLIQKICLKATIQFVFLK